MTPKVTWHWGIPYEDSLAWQIRERSNVYESSDPMSISLLLCEHPPTITIGKRGGTIHHQRMDTVVHQIKRGGLATWHGPGQLAFYPIVPLQSHRIGIKDYVCLLEQTVIDGLQHYGVTGQRQNTPGIWVGNKKIASIGVEVREGVTNHGIAINVHPDLDRFADIIPCGDPNVIMTSLEYESSEKVSILELGQQCIKIFTKRYSKAIRT